MPFAEKMQYSGHRSHAAAGGLKDGLGAEMAERGLNRGSRGNHKYRKTGKYCRQKDTAWSIDGGQNGGGKWSHPYYRAPYALFGDPAH